MAGRRMLAGMQGRRGVAALLALPVLLSLAFAGSSSLRPGTLRSVPCWILPNLRTIAIPAAPACELGFRDALRKAAVDGRVVTVGSLAQLRDLAARSSGVLPVLVERDGVQVPVALPIVSTTRLERVARLAIATIAACLLLLVPFALLIWSSAPAAVPLALFYCAFAVISVPVLSGRTVGLPSIAALAGMALAPGTLFHLALRFPKQARVEQEAPAVLLVPYGLSGMLLVLGSLSIWRTPTLWPAFVSLLVAICAMAWIVLISSCAFGLWESSSALERARARIVLFGSLLLPAVPCAVEGLGRGSDAGEVLVLYLWVASATMPLPIALAISRYNLFDLGMDARHGIARVLYVSVSAVALASAAWVGARVVDVHEALPDTPSMLAIALACALVVEPVRVRLPGVLETLILPRIQSLRDAYVTLERRLPALLENEDISHCVEDALTRGMKARGGAVYLTEGDSLNLVHAFGVNPPSGSALAESAVEVLGPERVVHIAARSDASEALEKLRRAEVSVAAAIESGEDRLGLVLLGPPLIGSHYTRMELDFVGSVASRAGSAFFRVRTSEMSRAEERQSAAGRLALALAHDTGKDIRWLKLLSRRLAGDPEASHRARRDAAMIAELTDELAASFRRVLEEASRFSDASADLPLCDDVLDRAIRRLGHLHAGKRVVYVIDPSLRGLRCPEYLSRLVGNVLDNALIASPEDEPVRLFATLECDRVRIVVEDRGGGIPTELGDRVFEPGVTTRRSEGGSGMGLTVAREIARMLGGSIRLERRSGGGTTTTIDLPGTLGAEAGIDR